MKTIDAQQVKRMLDSNEKFELINVLSEDAFQQKHIPGSINIPVEGEDFLDRVEQRTGGEKDRTIVVYCANTDCTASPSAAEMLDEAGYTNVLDFEAGTEGWEEAGYPIESGKVRA